MTTSYHVHSTYSDGHCSIRELALAAADAGLDELGISDHYVLLASGDLPGWSMPLEALPRYLDEIRAAAEELDGRLLVRYGLEADFDPGTWRELGDVLARHPFDYVIGSVHFIDGFPVDTDRRDWDDLTQPQRNDMVRAYLDRIRQLTGTGLFDFVGHLDLYKKFGHAPTVDVSQDVAAVLDAIAASGMAVELNTAGWSMPVREAYPSPTILAGCRRRGAPVVITADAHHTSNLTRDYDRAQALLRATGYTETAAFAGRQMRLAAL